MRFFILLFLFSLPALAQTNTKPLSTKLAIANESFWQSAQEPKGNVTSRGLFAYALVLCEANENLQRLELLFTRAAQMQDRNPQSRSYGNFKWKWSDEKIVDYNAVDFSMRGGSLLWLKHRAKIPLAAREKLREILEFSVEGLMRHRVREDYTNIALMNACDLILLGEALDKPNVADEGYKRLERVLLYTHQFGTHEYVSPTYYGPDLDALVMIEAFAKKPRGVEQARALLEFFWTDIALNWYAPAERLSGAHSRSYDYLSGLGELDTQLQLNGWLPGQPTRIDAIYSAQARWKPGEELKKLNQQYPRLAQQKWGIEDSQWRTNYIQKDVALSTAGASYGGRMDFPLTVDFPGPRNGVRCYFTSDGRGDPYGKIRIAESATHSKALHLNPLWAASQSKERAVALVFYRDGDIPPDSEILQSHFVMPLDNDGLWIDDKKIDFQKGVAARHEMQPAQRVLLKKGAAALAVRVVDPRDVKGQAAPLHLVYDGNNFGAIRLTVTHYKGGPIGVVQQKQPAGTGFEVEAQQLADKTSAVNLKGFEPQSSDHNAMDSLRPLPPDSLFVRMQPEPIIVGLTRFDGVLSLNGNEIGRKILQQAEPLKSASNAATMPQISLPATGGIYFEAESAQLLPPFEIANDAMASSGQFAWMPGEIGGRGGSSLGSLTWKLQNETAGEWYLWGRVKAATPEDDSFFVRVWQNNNEVLPATTWSLGTHEKWQWVRWDEKINLPPGEAQLQLRVREDGAQIDRLFLTRNVTSMPD